MGLFSLLDRMLRRDDRAAAPAVDGTVPAKAAVPLPDGGNPEAWVEVPPYLPADPRDHARAAAIACAIAAGDNPTSTFTVKSLSVENPEHRRVAVVAAALAAGAAPERELIVRRVYRKADLEDGHAA